MTANLPWSRRIAGVFSRRYPIRDPRHRTLGREGEHPVVHPDGRAADIAVLWPALMALPGARVQREGDLVVAVELDDVIFSAEVGRGTLEIIVGPCDTLHEIQQRYEAAMARLLAVTNEHGVLVLGYGIQPRTPASPGLMTDKQRYGVLLERIGPPWLSFATTASDQVHVSVARDELVAATNLGNLVTPIVVALLANSSVAGGKALGTCSGREAAMNRIQAAQHRHGMPAKPAADLTGWIEPTLGLDFLMRREGDRNVAASGTFDAWLNQVQPTDDEAYDAWMWHEHYVWNSARPRAAHGTVELRAACQQPWREHMSNAALGAGVITGHVEIARTLSAKLGPDAWNRMARWQRDVVTLGLEATEPEDGVIADVLALAQQALQERGHDEAHFLDPLVARLAARRNPAQAAASVFAEGGVPALVEHTRVR